MGKKDVRTIAEFDRLVAKNKASDKHWYHGLKDKQLRGMLESDARMCVAILEAKERTEREAKERTEREAKERTEREAKERAEREKREKKEKKEAKEREKKAKEKEAKEREKREAKEREKREAKERETKEREAKEREAKEREEREEREAKEREEREAKEREEREAKEREAKEREERDSEEFGNSSIVIVSSWNIMCGIAIYTEDLLRELGRLDDGKYMGRFIVRGVKSLEHRIKNINGVTHLQHEFGIMKKPPKIKGRVIVTFHTIPYDIGDTLRKFESALDIVGYIVPCSGALDYMTGGTSKDVYVVPLGSKLISDDNAEITKEEARKRIGIPKNGINNMAIGFVFGFQSKNKNYERLTLAARNTGIHLIISGSIHNCGYKSDIKNNENVTILERHLDDKEIDLYALASDLLLFDYAEQDHYSSSASLHRTVGSGRPIICCDTKHFNDVQYRDGYLKFRNQQELEICIRYALANQESLGKASLEFARKTSWGEVARRHIDIYSKHTNL